MNVLILGANGFLGSSLKCSYEISGDVIYTASYREDKHQESLDVIENIIASKSLDLIVNAAASQLTQDNPSALSSLVNSNVLMPAVLCSLIKKYQPALPLINFGTSWQIGEDGKSEPFNAYAASKSSAEAFFDHFAQDGLKIASLRLYDTYGPKDKRNKVINLIADSLINRTELGMSSGEQAVDFVFIQDVIKAVELTHKHLISSINGCHEKFSVRSFRVVTILELLEIMKNVIGLEESPWIRPGVYPYRLRERFSLADECQTVPEWNAVIDLEEGVRLVMLDRGWSGK
jgi:CDP-3, 6-dideoxy-D-glycero-L-glycero-4-hexulose-4-reductase